MGLCTCSDMNLGVLILPVCHLATCALTTSLFCLSTTDLERLTLLYSLELLVSYPSICLLRTKQVQIYGNDTKCKMFTMILFQQLNQLI